MALTESSVFALLGRVTCLTADEAKEMLGRFVDKTNSSPHETSPVAALLIHLGGSVAATEREIMEIANLIASATTRAGIPARHTLTIAATLACGATQTAAAEVLVDLMMDDQIPVILQAGERVLSRTQSEAIETLMTDG